MPEHNPEAISPEDFKDFVTTKPNEEREQIEKIMKAKGTGRVVLMHRDLPCGMRFTFIEKLSNKIYKTQYQYRGPCYCCDKGNFVSSETGYCMRCDEMSVPIYLKKKFNKDDYKDTDSIVVKTIYQCHSCAIEFEKPREIIREIDGKEYEMNVCPNCEGHNYKKKQS